MMSREQIMQEKTGNIISIILHPLWLPLTTLILLFTVPSFLQQLPDGFKRFDLMIVAINTVLIPAAYTVIFYRLRIIRSFFMESREERFLPLILYIVFTYVSYIVLKKVHQPSILWQIMLVVSAIAFFCLLINFKWKISLHMAGFGGVSGMLLIFSFRINPVYTNLWILSLFLGGILGSARLSSGQHQMSEVYLGFLGGFCLAAVLLWYMV